MTEDLFDRLRNELQARLNEDAPEVSPGPPPQTAQAAQSVAILPGAVVVSGVALPQNVIDQLRRLGLPLAWYTHGQLQEAVQACAVDCTLIDDDDGIDFDDKLHFSASEAELRTLGLRISGQTQWNGTASAHRANIADIRNSLLGLAGPQPFPAAH